MGKPRRFSTSFIMKEREDLAEYRMKVRRIQYLRTQRPAISAGYLHSLEGIPKVLSKGDKVTAYNPKTNFVHEGIIVGVELAAYLVKFCHEELGIAHVPDTQVMVRGFFLHYQLSLIVTKRHL